jgi:hypothetical protein
MADIEQGRSHTQKNDRGSIRSYRLQVFLPRELQLIADLRRHRSSTQKPDFDQGGLIGTRQSNITFILRQRLKALSDQPQRRGLYTIAYRKYIQREFLILAPAAHSPTRRWPYGPAMQIQSMPGVRI